MLFDIPFVADWRKIGERRQSLTDRGNQHENAKCIDYDYKVGDKVLVNKEGPSPTAASAAALPPPPSCRRHRQASAAALPL
jgi:hypothetical protein